LGIEAGGGVVVVRGGDGTHNALFMWVLFGRVGTFWRREERAALDCGMFG